MPCLKMGKHFFTSEFLNPYEIIDWTNHRLAKLLWQKEAFIYVEGIVSLKHFYLIYIFVYFRLKGRKKLKQSIVF